MPPKKSPPPTPETRDAALRVALARGASEPLEPLIAKVGDLFASYVVACAAVTRRRHPRIEHLWETNWREIPGLFYIAKSFDTRLVSFPLTLYELSHPLCPTRLQCPLFLETVIDHYLAGTLLTLDAETAWTPPAPRKRTKDKKVAA